MESGQIDFAPQINSDETVVFNNKGMGKIEIAIALLKAFEPVAGYYGAFSGGKDSVVIKHLAIMAGLKVIWHYCVSPIDPPEIHQFIKENYPDVEWDYHARGWWKTVAKRGLPRRDARWCCEHIKESGGDGRVVIVGNRRSEGRKRSRQQCFGKHTKRDVFYVRPIISWTSREVWRYIRDNNLPYCSLYDEGTNKKGYGKGDFKRLGCVLCPAASKTNRLRELERFPKIAKLWRRSCDHIVARRLTEGKDSFKTGEELWEWFIK